MFVVWRVAHVQPQTVSDLHFASWWCVDSVPPFNQLRKLIWIQFLLYERNVNKSHNKITSTLFNASSSVTGPDFHKFKHWMVGFYHIHFHMASHWKHISDSLFYYHKTQTHTSRGILYKYHTQAFVSTHTHTQLIGMTHFWVVLIKPTSVICKLHNGM